MDRSKTPSNSNPISSTSGGLPTRKQKKKKKKPKSVAKLLELPTNPHDRLTTLHARLNLPCPFFTIIEQKRWRAVVRSDDDDGTAKSTKEVIGEPWCDDNASDQVWSLTQKAAREEAARDACKALEVRLVKSLTGRDDVKGEEMREEGEIHVANEEVKQGEVLDAAAAAGSEYDEYDIEIDYD